MGGARHEPTRGSQAKTRVGACSVVGGAGISTTRQERTEGQASRYMYLPMGEEA